MGGSGLILSSTSDLLWWVKELEHLTVSWAQVGFVHAEDHFWSDEEEKHTGYGRAYKSVSLG